jgi:hypothetical protein
MSTGLAYPAALPPFLAQGHTREPLAVCEAVEMDLGNSRLRRWFTSAPEFTEVATRLTQAEFDSFDAFFEEALQAGARSFYVPIAGPGFSTGVEWWEARYAGPYRAAFKAGRWRVGMRLRLLDGPFETRPLGDSLGAEGVISVDGAATLTVSRGLGGEGVISVDGDATLAALPQALAGEGVGGATADAELTLANYRSTEDADIRVTEDGARRVIEA